MRPSVREFIKILKELDHSKHRDEVFRDFCELAYCALAKKACPWPDQREALEAQYMEVVGKYRNKDDVRRMPELLGIALMELSTGGCDFLGEIAGELGALEAKMGQFFTPYEVSRLMAEINLTGIEHKIEQQGFVTLQEPSAGAGGMLIAVADKIEGLGLNLETSLWIEAVELSRSTFHMCYLQCAARGLSGRVFHGNTLTLETYGSALTAGAHVFLAKNGNPFAKQEAEAMAAADQQKKAADERTKRLQSLPEKPAIRGEQLSLF